jgi:hypothetical protein
VYRLEIRIFAQRRPSFIRRRNAQFIQTDDGDIRWDEGTNLANFSRVRAGDKQLRRQHTEIGHRF